MIRVLRTVPFAALCAAAVVSACAKGDKTADSAKVADSTAAANASTAPSTATAAPAPAAAPMSDANIFAALDEANRADSAGGALAATKGTGAEVKAFGKEMMKDHHALRVGGQALAKKLNITPEPAPSDSSAAAHKTLADSLAAMPKGAAWDKYYIDHAVTGHEAVLTTAQNAMSATQNAEVKAMLTKASPIVQQHLDKAKAIQSKLQ
jgi:putative membrane protein